MSAESVVSSYEHNGFTITSNAATPAETEASFKSAASHKGGSTDSGDSGDIPDDASSDGDGSSTTITDDDADSAAVSKAASELGKRGAAALAAKRAEMVSVSTEDDPKPAPAPVKAKPIPPATPLAKAPPTDAKTRAAKEGSNPPTAPGTDDDPVAEGKRAEKAAAEDISKAPPEKRKQLASERVGEATRAAAEAKRALSAERQAKEQIAQELNALRRERAAAAVAAATPLTTSPAPAPAAAAKAPTVQPSVGATADGAPKYEDYPDITAYVKAAVDWGTEQALIKREREAQVDSRAKAHTAAVVTHVDTFNKRVTEANVFDRVSDQIKNLQPSFLLAPGQAPGPTHVICDEIMSSEQAPALMVHFSDHPEDFQRIASLKTPRDIAREMAKLETRIEAQARSDQDEADASTRESSTPTATDGASTVPTPPPTPAVSRAKPPLSTVKGAPVTEEAGYREGMSLDDYARTWKLKHSSR